MDDDPRPSGNRSSRPRETDVGRRAARRQEIVARAVELFSERGYRNATMGELADLFEVTKPALYYYVGSKEQLLLAALEMAFDRLERHLDDILATTSDPVEQIRRWILSQVETAADPSARMLSGFDLNDDGLDDPILDAARRRNRAYLGRVTAMIRDGQEAGALRADLDPTVTVFGLIGMCSWTARWYKPGQSLEVEQIAWIYSTLVLDSLRG